LEKGGREGRMKREAWREKRRRQLSVMKVRNEGKKEGGR